MGIDWTKRWQYLKDTQLRKSSMLVFVIPTAWGLLTAYDAAVSQFAKNPEKLWRASDSFDWLSWEQWIFAALVLGAVFVFDGAFRYSRTMDGLLRQFEAVQLDIFYDDTNPTCKRDLLFENGNLKQRVWRVGIRGSRGRITEGVIVRMEDTDPRIPDLPRALHPMSGEGINELEWSGDGSFDIRPGDTSYVDVIRYQPTENGEGMLWFTFQLGNPPIGLRVELRSYTLRLTAIGNDGPGKSARFQFELGDEVPQFVQIADAVDAS